ncbi:hypothetical protein RRG08_034406 [Elysia crispata]|uniref:G-protein coupled receptors family 1 profile domain-containing protein n=1 Tax=Elysia crispata TaxID=231223 RepID=A0AAE1CX68_9GAST|nr:hypothetical protein RRG08_034406 [Elysia crispata]
MWNFSETSPSTESVTSSTVQEFISIHLRNTFLKINGSILLVLSLAGIPNNILNMIIFSKMGFNSNINIQFFSLSAIDFICSCFYVCVAVIMQDMSGLIDLRVDLTDVIYLTASVLSSLSAIGSWVTAIISVERCCSVVLPVRVKDIFTRKVTMCLNVGMLIVQMAFLASNVSSMRFKVTRSSLNYRPRVTLDNSRMNDTLYVALLFWGASFITFICMGVIVISTAYLGIALLQRDIWLESLPARTNQAGRKNKKLVHTVVAISAIYIICSLPGVIVLLTLFIDPSLSPFDPTTESLSIVLSTFIQICLSFSGMANMFVYLKMNSKYREHFKIILCFACAQIRMRCGSD